MLTLESFEVAKRVKTKPDEVAYIHGSFVFKLHYAYELLYIVYEATVSLHLLCRNTIMHCPITSKIRSVAKTREST